MEFSRQEYWIGLLSCPPPGECSGPGVEPRSPALQTDSLSSELPGKHRMPVMPSIILGEEMILKILVWGAIPFSRGSSQPRTEPKFPALQVDSLLSEPPGKWQH